MHNYKLIFKKEALEEWLQCEPFVQRQLKYQLKARLSMPKRGADRLDERTQSYKITLTQSQYRLVYQVREDTQEIVIIAITHRAFHHLW